MTRRALLPAIDESDIEVHFIRASGPGGQNVNKVSTAVELRFDVQRCASLSEPVRIRLRRIAGRRLTKDGILVIRADRHRTQEQNRQDARDRLDDLLSEAAAEPKPRVATKPTRASKARRRDAKSRRADTKRNRSRPLGD